MVGAGRPVRAPKLIPDLFREKFAGLGEEIDAGFGFDMVRLSVREAAPADPAQIDLAGDAVGEADLAGLIDRIGARLGPSRVSRIVPQESHVPERAAVFAAAGESTDPPPQSGEGDRRGGGGGELKRCARGLSLHHARTEPALAEFGTGLPVG